MGAELQAGGCGPGVWSPRERVQSASLCSGPAAGAVSSHPARKQPRQEVSPRAGHPSGDRSLRAPIPLGVTRKTSPFPKVLGADPPTSEACFSACIISQLLRRSPTARAA